MAKLVRVGETQFPTTSEVLVPQDQESPAQVLGSHFGWGLRTDCLSIISFVWKCLVKMALNVITCHD